MNFKSLFDDKFSERDRSSRTKRHRGYGSSGRQFQDVGSSLASRWIGRDVERQRPIHGLRSDGRSFRQIARGYGGSAAQGQRETDENPALSRRIGQCDGQGCGQAEDGQNRTRLFSHNQRQGRQGDGGQRERRQDRHRYVEWRDSRD
jgi:hypothetical protein